MCIRDRHIAGQHLTIIGAVVHYLTLRIYLVETAREKHRTVETRVESTPVSYTQLEKYHSM